MEMENYTFDLINKELWLPYLESMGYCVLKNVIDRDKSDNIKNMIWEDMTALYEVKRDEVTTWRNIPNGSAGIIGKGISQSRGPWVVRSSEEVRSAFSSIWETDNLLVSMDSLLLWLPWWLNDAWKPVSEGVHLDQNPYFKPNKCCVQGMVPLIEVTDVSGGLEVIPQSHLSETTKMIKSQHPQFSHMPFDFCVIRRGLDGMPRILLKADPGDLILWDSRLIHGGRVGTGIQESAEIELARLSVTVCMTPKELASDRTLTARLQGYQDGKTYSHWPHEAVCTSGGPPNYVPVELSPRVLELIS